VWLWFLHGLRNPPHRVLEDAWARGAGEASPPSHRVVTVHVWRDRCRRGRRIGFRSGDVRQRKSTPLHLRRASGEAINPDDHAIGSGAGGRPSRRWAKGIWHRGTNGVGRRVPSAPVAARSQGREERECDKGNDRLGRTSRGKLRKHARTRVGGIAPFERDSPAFAVPATTLLKVDFLRNTRQLVRRKKDSPRAASERRAFVRFA
jgi:hypothetical protein